MKNISFLLIVTFLFGSPLLLQAQKNQSGQYADINYDKVEYVAETKTEQLAKIVGLDGKNQKKKVYQIYRNNEVKKQKKLRDAKFVKKQRYKKRPNRVHIVHTEYDERKEIELLDKLDEEAQQKVEQTLTNKQKQLLAKHNEKEKYAVEQ